MHYSNLKTTLKSPVGTIILVFIIKLLLQAAGCSSQGGLTGRV